MSVLSTPILLYHHVEDAEPSPPPRFAGSYLTLAELKRQLDDLERRGLGTVTVSRAAAGTAGRSIALTFDDGCECFRRVVAPELARRGMTATVFAVAELVGGENRWDAARGERSERLMDAAALRQLTADGYEVGCHSATHRDLTRVGPDELAAEVAGARQTLAATLGAAPATFCYPYGRFDAAARAAVEAAGFAAAVSVWGYPGASRADRLALPRVGIEPGETRIGFRLKTSGLYPWIRRLPRLGVLAARGRRPAGEGAG